MADALYYKKHSIVFVIHINLFYVVIMRFIIVKKSLEANKLKQHLVMAMLIVKMYY